MPAAPAVLPSHSLPPEFHADRRRQLARKIREGVVVLAAAPVFPRQRDDEYHPYAPDAPLRYLTGCAEPQTALVLAVRNAAVAREILFCRPRDPAAEQWAGERLGPRRAKKILGINEAEDRALFEKKLREIAADFSDLWFIPGARPDLDARVINLAKTRRAANRAGARPLAALRDLSLPLDEMRLVKTPHEIAALREAADIAVAAVRAAMRASARRECELEAVIVAEYRRRGAQHAFAPIVAAGPNACCLHYQNNAAPVRRNDLVLIDTGCEKRGYCSDITRVFPAGGKFSAPQREVTEVVLRAHQRAAAKVRPGARMDAPETAAVRALAEGLRDLGVLRGAPETIIARARHKRFYMHRIGHFLGMDTHDPGRMTDDNGAPRLFAPGMVLTIEPGLYFPDAPDIPKHFRGIGVRLEDDLLVTPAGRQNLTAPAPKSPREVEEWMRG